MASGLVPALLLPAIFFHATMTTLFWIISGIVTFGFILERSIDYLNTTRWSDSLPDELRGIYDEEKYRRQQVYSKTNHRFGMVTDTFGFLLMAGMLFFGGFAWNYKRVV